MLHLITPLAHHSPEELLDAYQVQFSDLIVDMRLFPNRLYKYEEDVGLKDVTAVSSGNLDYWKVAGNWFSEFTQKSRLQELLSIRGIGFWWANNCLDFTPTLSDYGNLFAWIDLLKKIKQDEQPEDVVIYGRHQPIQQIAQQIWAQTDTNFSFKGGEKRSSEKRPERIIGLIFVRLLMSLPVIVYMLLKRPEIAFFSTTNLLRQKGIGPKKKILDIYLDEVAIALRGNGWSTIFVEKYGWNASWAGLRARGLFLPSDLFSVLANSEIVRSILFRRLASKWQLMWKENRDSIVQHMVYRDIDLRFILEPKVKREFINSGPRFSLLAGIWHYLFRVWKPKLLYIHCSYCQASLAAIIAAKKLSILTIEQQHGAISNSNMPYLIPGYISQHRSHLCDKMTIWGERTVRLLEEKSAFTKQQLAVCGSPRIDWLLDELPSRDATLSILDILQPARIVLYTSNMLAESLMYDVLDSVERNPIEDIFWIIKLHPREKTRQLWEEAIQERALSRIRVIESELDFYALLAACDVHISMASTTLLESAILGKLNIGLKLGTLPDPAGYEEANAFYPVAPNQLQQTVCRTFEDPEWVRKELEKQKSFADDWCRHDGQAVERIVDFISQLT